jgi:hypothetical protein
MLTPYQVQNSFRQPKQHGPNSQPALLSQASCRNGYSEHATRQLRSKPQQTVVPKVNKSADGDKITKRQNLCILVSIIDSESSTMLPPAPEPVVTQMVTLLPGAPAGPVSRRCAAPAGSSSLRNRGVIRLGCNDCGHSVHWLTGSSYSSITTSACETRNVCCLLFFVPVLSVLPALLPRTGHRASTHA